MSKRCCLLSGSEEVVEEEKEELKRRVEKVGRGRTEKKNLAEASDKK